MAKFYPRLDESLRDFISRQKVFFTATAPNSGRINLSPKGMDTFRIIDDETVGYLDLTGSGNETAAHLTENGRMTVMFCSFETRPLILRLYGKGKVVRRRMKEWKTLYPHFCPTAGERQIILLKIDSAQTSCGYGVPFYEFLGERETLRRWAEAKGEEGIKDYWRGYNERSIDGLPNKWPW